MTLCIQIEWLFYNAFWCETVTRKWRWLHPRHGGTCPHFYTGTKSKKNKRQESDQTVLTTRKRLPKRLIVLVKPKKWRARQKNFRRFAPDMCLPPLNFWCFWYDELMEQFTEHLWQTVPHRSRHSCCACKSGVHWKGFFCVRPAYCWSQKQNDQVIANASLFATEQKNIGEHRHQCLCVNFGTLTLMEINCKLVSTKAAIQYSVVWQILCCVLLLNVSWNCTKYNIKLYKNNHILTKTKLILNQSSINYINTTTK